MLNSLNNMSLPRNVKISDQVLFQEIEGESVLLNLDNEQYFGLDEVGTRIWHLLSENGETRKTLNLLLDEYKVDKAKLENDLSDLIEDLRDQGLVMVEY